MASLAFDAVSLCTYSLSSCVKLYIYTIVIDLYLYACRVSSTQNDRKKNTQQHYLTHRSMSVHKVHRVLNGFCDCVSVCMSFFLFRFVLLCSYDRTCVCMHVYTSCWAIFNTVCVYPMRSVKHNWAGRDCISTSRFQPILSVVYLQLCRSTDVIVHVECFFLSN